MWTETATCGGRSAATEFREFFRCDYEWMVLYLPDSIQNKLFTANFHVNSTNYVTSFYKKTFRNNSLSISEQSIILKFHGEKQNLQIHFWVSKAYIRTKCIYEDFLNPVLTIHVICTSELLYCTFWCRNSLTKGLLILRIRQFPNLFSIRRRDILLSPPPNGKNSHHSNSVLHSLNHWHSSSFRTNTFQRSCIRLKTQCQNSDVHVLWNRLYLFTTKQMTFSTSIAELYCNYKQK